VQIDNMTLTHDSQNTIRFVNDGGEVIQTITAADQQAELADYDAAIAQLQSDKQTFADMIAAVLAEPPVDPMQ
jgi:putative heme degradation protein